MKTGGYLKVFVDWRERYQKLSDAEFGRLIRAALAYKAGETVPELNGREELVWDGIKLDIDRDKEQYEAACQAKSEAGKRGAEARWNSTSQNGNSKNSICHLPYGKNSQDKEKEKEEEEDKKENENEKENEKNNIMMLTHHVSARTDYMEAVNAYNELCAPTLPAVKQVSDTRKGHIKTGLARLKKAGITWHEYFSLAAASDFLMGRNGAWHGCGFDWLIKPANMLKVLEGNYENRLPAEQDEEQKRQAELDAWARGDID